MPYAGVLPFIACARLWQVMQAAAEVCGKDDCVATAPTDEAKARMQTLLNEVYQVIDKAVREGPELRPSVFHVHAIFRVGHLCIAGEAARS